MVIYRCKITPKTCSRRTSPNSIKVQVYIFETHKHPTFKFACMITPLETHMAYMHERWHTNIYNLVYKHTSPNQKFIIFNLNPEFMGGMYRHTSIHAWAYAFIFFNVLVHVRPWLRESWLYMTFWSLTPTNSWLDFHKSLTQSNLHVLDMIHIYRKL